MCPFQLLCIICSSSNFTYPPTKGNINSKGKGGGGGGVQKHAISARVGGSKTGVLSKTNSCTVKQAIG